MRTVIVILLCSFLLQGCYTETQYIQVCKTESLNLKGVNDFYIYENDTVRIVYYFWSEDGIMAFNIYNKSDKPLYIDWRKSTFITNSSKSNYWTDKTTIKGSWGGSSSGYTSAFTTLAGSSQTILEQQSKLYKNGVLDSKSQSNSTNSTSIESNATTFSNFQAWSHMTVSKDERITFMPPRTFINNSIAFKIKTYYYNDWQSGGYTQVKEPLLSDPKIETTISSKKFTKSNSPLDFRNFLTLSFKEDFSNEFYIDNEFYIKEIIAMDKRHFFLYKYDNSKTITAEEIGPKYKNGVDFYVKGY